MLYYQQNRNPKVPTAEVVGDALVTGKVNEVDQVLRSINVTFKLGEVVLGHATPRYFGFNIAQREDLMCAVDSKNKLNFMKSANLTCSQRKAVNYSRNEFESNTFASLKSALGWLGTSVSLYGTTAVRGLQKRLLAVHI